MLFDQWVVEKKVKDTDLVFTKALKSSDHLDQFQKWSMAWTAFKPSFSEGLQVLEWITDLILLDQDRLQSDLLNLEPNPENKENFKKQIREWRFPLSRQIENDFENKFQNLSWPSGVKPKFERRGDRFGAEIKFFISNELDLTKAIALLERIKSDWPKSN